MSDEFPLLEGLGLYASDIIGDGDCLFRSFSDQLYGHQDKAHEIRRRTTAYMRTHSDFFKLFLSVAPPRKNKSSSSTKIPTETAIDKAFNDHVTRMEKSGVYGDNLEIVAFARCYTVNVKIYQREFAYQVSCSDDDSEVAAAKLLHIAYHSWEHYSSVRNVDGPHSGVPDVKPKVLTADGKKKQQDVIDKGVAIMPWMEKVVEQSLPAVLPKEKVREMLEKCKGDVNLAVSKLLDQLEDEEEKERGGGDVDDLDEDEQIALAMAMGDAVGEIVPEGVKEDNGKEPAAVKGVSEPGEKSKGGSGGKDKAAAAGAGKGTKKGSTPAKANGTKPSNTKQQPKGNNRPKKETARERKERQKRENLERKKAKAAGASAESSVATRNKTDASGGPTNGLEEGIKTLHI